MASAKGVASWQQRPGPRSRHQGQAQAGQLQASPRALAAQSDPTGTQRLAWCPPGCLRWPLRLASRTSLHGCLSAQPARGRRPTGAPGTRQDLGKRGRQTVAEIQRCAAGSGARAGIPRRRQLQSPWGQTLPRALLPDTQSKRNQKSRFLFCQKLLEHSMGQQNPRYIWPLCTQ